MITVCADCRHILWYFHSLFCIILHPIWFYMTSCSTHRPYTNRLAIYTRKTVIDRARSSCVTCDCTIIIIIYYVYVYYTDVITLYITVVCLTSYSWQLLYRQGQSISIRSMVLLYNNIRFQFYIGTYALLMRFCKFLEHLYILTFCVRLHPIILNLYTFPRV